MTRTNLVGLAAVSLMALVISPACGREDRIYSGPEGGTAGSGGSGGSGGSVVGSGGTSAGSPTQTAGTAPDGGTAGEGGGAGQAPIGGVTCTAEQKECGGVCVAIDDPAYGCSPTLCSPSACPSVEGATLVCQSGACVVGSCEAGDKSCGGTCVAQDDPAFGCGASTCDASGCPSPGAGGSVKCDGGACVIDTCGPTLKKCGDKCVSISDPNYGCGDSTCDASSCPAPGSGTLICQAGQCVIGTCGANTKNCNSKCVPTDVNNGCASTASCTACASNQACSGSPSTCQCVPTAQSTACAGKCGSVPNGCGGNHTCGGCTAPNTCAGGGTANVCGCTALTKTVACAGKTCGSASNGCGGNISCGSCSSDLMCVSGTCQECAALSDCEANYYACTNGSCACAAQTSVNLLTNAGFDRNLTGWTVTAATWALTDSDECPRSGSATLTGGTIRQCVRNAAGGKDYTLGLRYIGASGTSVGCFGTYHSDTNCTSGLGPDFLNLSGSSTGAGFWQPTTAGTISPAGTKSILVECSGFGDSGAIIIDQIYLSVGKPGSAGAHF